MSEPRITRTLEALANGIRRAPAWKCEEPLNALLDAWIQEMGAEFLPSSQKRRGELYAASRDVLEELGEQEGPHFIVWACRKMRREMLTVKTPRSLMFLLPEWRARGESTEESYESRGRYLDGILGDT